MYNDKVQRRREKSKVSPLEKIEVALLRQDDRYNNFDMFVFHAKFVNTKSKMKETVWWQVRHCHGWATPGHPTQQPIQQPYVTIRGSMASWLMDGFKYAHRLIAIRTCSIDVQLGWHIGTSVSHLCRMWMCKDLTTVCLSVCFVEITNMLRIIQELDTCLPVLQTHTTHTLTISLSRTHTTVYVHAMLQSAAIIKLFVQFRKKNNSNSIDPKRFPEIPRVAEMLQSRSTHLFFPFLFLSMSWQ